VIMKLINTAIREIYREIKAFRFPTIQAMVPPNIKITIRYKSIISLA